MKGTHLWAWIAVVQVGHFESWNQGQCLEASTSGIDPSCALNLDRKKKQNNARQGPAELAQVSLKKQDV